MKRLIPGYKQYKASTDGSIYSYSRKNPLGRRLVVTYCQKYLTINLCEDAIATRYLIHRLIAQTFIPNPHNLPCVNHKDGNRLNNAVSNLEWTSYSDNLKHKHRVLKNRQPWQRITVIKFERIKLLRSQGLSYRKIAKRVGYSSTQVHEIYNHQEHYEQLLQ